jgi:hypothetical protein
LIDFKKFTFAYLNSFAGMIDDLMECHLYCSHANINKMFVDCNNMDTVHWYYMLFHMTLMGCNKMMDGCMHRIVENLNK